MLLDGVVGVEIGPQDVLIMDGSRYHAVAPLRSLPGKNFTMQPLRHSLVHFTKSMHVEQEEAGNYWVEPEGGLKRTRASTRAGRVEAEGALKRTRAGTKAALQHASSS